MTQNRAIKEIGITEIEIDPQTFELKIFHRSMDFFIQAQLAADVSNEGSTKMILPLPQLRGFYPAPKQVSDIGEFTPLLRNETLRAREDFARKHFMPKVWKLTGQEAVNAFKIEYTVIAGQTIWSGLDLKSLFKAYRAKEDRERRMQSEHDAHGLFPQYTMRYMLCSMWDGYFSHLSNKQEIADWFPRNLKISVEAINTAISQLKLPDGCGDFKITPQMVS
ncbi:hypothetical protein N9Z14_00320 [Opitutales bacterium]|nr:hypothetical protein [Opitutales bacterium]